MPRNPDDELKLKRREDALRANLSRRKEQVRAQRDQPRPLEMNHTESVEPEGESH